MPATTSSPIAPYPFAAAPDIIRSHQKDAYYTGHLTNTLTDLHRRILGARSAHALAPELRTAASLLYFALTTLPGNRTLGEEYCDLVQVDAATGRLPSVRRRAGYIAGSILLPYLVSRTLPGGRQRLRRLLERRLETLRRKDATAAAAAGVKTPQPSRETRLWEYILRHLPSLTSTAPLHALTLAVFYFSGTYYELTKRLLSLRYVFTRSVPDTPDRAGYEVLGVLLVTQLAVQTYLHVRSTLQSAGTEARERAAAVAAAGASDVSLDHDNSYSANNELLLPGAAQGPQATRVDIAATTHTPVGRTPKFELTDEKVMGYIKGAQQRKCTLCLEELKDPAATQCGHVFCWECIGDWVREKPECPLCRRDAMVQHILPLRAL
ncbi:Peroxisome biogenesis factor-like protein [Hapsidospora chrysogenum ATCC 11550]|uniref:RING-type E3 ubiquitin transferase n=1 Tax=Hapsidospora chrysogenum (strain ATCC 11550 / CBS 779.69 / DSM 880 / IAM 14645 / JCM 23072 / IMI 49137) TaxID=857340 RepID=A0A086TF89_HAPC1|nr:Peroxisome biogenesis factor-like protein [Hapsidospora chrysogenum ATCC 11550]